MNSRQTGWYLKHAAGEIITVYDELNLRISSTYETIKERESGIL